MNRHRAHLLNPITRAACCLVLSSLASGASAATDFNVRAVLDNGDYLAGTVAIDSASGTVVGENATLYRNGAVLSTFGAPTGQGPFSVPGLAPSYLFPSVGSNSFLFVGAVPGTSLVGYGGSELCSTSSNVHCATSDLFSSGSFVANVAQGIVARTSDDVRTFALEASFANGTRVFGSVTIDTTIGYVLDEHAFLYSGTTLLSEFSNPGGQNVFAPSGLNPAYLLQSLGTGGYLLNVAVPGASVVGYGGGLLCAVDTARGCAFSDIFLGDVSSNALTGSLTVAAVPEPSTYALLIAGLTALGWRRRRARDQAVRGLRRRATNPRAPRPASISA